MAFHMGPMQQPRSSPLLKFLFLLALLHFVELKVSGHQVLESEQYPLVVSTWPFLEAVRAAWRSVDGGSSAVDAVVDGCSACEELRCDGTVGPGGSPDENGETTIDAMVMDGLTMEVGAVAAMRYVKDGIKAAKLVMKHTKHTLLAGEKASEFAISMGLPGPTNLSSTESINKWAQWKDSKCQPNFRKNVLPIHNCGPYHPTKSLDLPEMCSNTAYMQDIDSLLPHVSLHSHDTISMAVIDKMGRVAVGTSTNGATFKIPGRVEDGPIVGSSAYADNEVGACCATGDGDIMMRFLPCYQVVESMRLGMSLHPYETLFNSTAIKGRLHRLILTIIGRLPSKIVSIESIKKKEKQKKTKIKCDGVGDNKQTKGIFPSSLTKERSLVMKVEGDENYGHVGCVSDGGRFSFMGEKDEIVAECLLSQEGGGKWETGNSLT